MIAYLKAGALKIKGLRGVLEGMVESTQKIKATKMDFTSPQKYTKYIKIWTLVRLKIRKGRELGGNHSMWWPPADL